MKVLSFTAPMLAAILVPAAAAGGPDWQHSFEEALALAVSEKKVVFVAVNMDGERANDWMVKEVYADKKILALTEHTVNLIASNDTHVKGDRKCSRFGIVTCAEHRRIDVSVRGQVLRPDAEGYVIAPQHVWLGPDGAVLLSVPYSISIPEMEWCFVTALRSVDPEFEHRLSTGARAPKRLIVGEVIDSKTAGERGGARPTRQEALDLLDQIKRGGGWGERERLIRRLAQADEPEAREYLITYLRASAGGRFGGGGRGGGGAGGAPGEENRPDRRAMLLRWIGEASPQSYWEVCAEFVSAGEDILRVESVVALEQLAAPESLKTIRSALGKEKNPKIKKNLFRALGTAGGADKSARKQLLRQAQDKRNELWRLNSIVALGYLAPEEDIDELLRATVEEKEGLDRQAAVLAMALTRDADRLEFLKETAKDLADDVALAEVLKRAIGVLEGEPIGTIREDVQRVASDEIVRRRIFATPPQPRGE